MTSPTMALWNEIEEAADLYFMRVKVGVPVAEAMEEILR